MLSACLALTGTSMGQNQYYVNASAGSDSNDGSQARPWKTIQHADAALTVGSGGAIVHVAPGTYSGSITTRKSGTSSARIVYISDQKWGAKIVSVNWLAQGSYIDINGFEMTSPGSGGVCLSTQGGTSTSTVASSVHFLNNYCHDISTSTCFSGGAINTNGTQGPFSVQSTDNWIIGNVIRHGGSGGASCNQTHGIYADGPRDIIQNNIISGFPGWGIHRIANSTGTPFVGVISNNTIFNNGGGILLSEMNNAGFQATVDYTTVSNNIIVNNGGNGSQTGFGINFFHVTGTRNLVTNNLIYGNLPSDYGHHGGICTGGTPISGTDGDGNAGGCPSVGARSDASTSVTFVNFQSDTNAAPASNYDSDNYQVKAGSSAIQHGGTNCASSPGLSPCVAPTDVVGVLRPIQTGSTLDIGAFEQASATVGLPSAPTGLTASVQ